MSDISDLDLLKELGVEFDAPKPKKYSPLEARLIAGFEDILKFHEEHGRAPEHGSDNDIFERLYAVRLDQLRKNEQAQGLLTSMDKNGLLKVREAEEETELDDEALLAELGVSVEAAAEDITTLRHVSPVAHRRAAEEIANREVCRDFEKFEPLFHTVKQDLESGLRKTVEKTTQDDFDVGRFFIIKGQMAYVAERGKDVKATGKNIFDARLRVIFDNGTESDLLMRSLQRSFNEKKNNPRAISNLNSGPLFGEDTDTENQTGIIYVLRSKSNLPMVTPIRDAILKIGVTGGTVKSRIANALNDPTYLLGEVEVVDEFTLYNINRKKLENMLHRIFADAQVQLTIPDRFGKPVQPREWFLVTQEAVAKAVEYIQSGEIQSFIYDHKAAIFVEK